MREKNAFFLRQVFSVRIIEDDEKRERDRQRERQGSGDCPKKASGVYSSSSLIKLGAIGFVNIAAYSRIAF